jgi:hypothetical protein
LTVATLMLWFSDRNASVESSAILHKEATTE